MQTQEIFKAQMEPTANLFRPLEGKLYPFQKYFPSLGLLNRMQQISPLIENLVTDPSHPSITLQSFHQDDYHVGLYQKLGSGESSELLRNDLMFFLQAQKKTQSPYLSFWAVFEEEDFAEADFEAALWVELSLLTSAEDRNKDWGQNYSTESGDPSFRISLGGNELFVRGLHSQCKHKNRRFAYPTLIFNTFSQHDHIDRSLSV